MRILASVFMCVYVLCIIRCLWEICFYLWLTFGSRHCLNWIEMHCLARTFCLLLTASALRPKWSNTYTHTWVYNKIQYTNTFVVNCCAYVSVGDFRSPNFMALRCDCQVNVRIFEGSQGRVWVFKNYERMFEFLYGI